jgi:N-acetylglutamate synthase-like GNAT family acetyltransferase
VRQLLGSSFAPILDVATGEDLLQLMVASGESRSGDYDFRGMHSLLLRSAATPVCAAVLRVLGTRLAELPLLATAVEARGQGHAGVMVRSLQELLHRLGVKRLALPAAAEAEAMWRCAFGFEQLGAAEVAAAVKEHRLLVFPGSTVLAREPEACAGLLPPSIGLE